MNRFKDLAKNTMIITIGKISTQLVTFFLLPLYTAVLTTSEYGTVDLITTLVQLFIPIVSIMIDQSLFRYLLNCNSNIEYKKNISSAFFVLTILNILSIFVYFIIFKFIQIEYKVWILFIITVTTYSNLFLQIARGLKDVMRFSIGSFICSCSIIFLNLLCIIALKLGALGMIISIFLGNLFCVIYLFFALRIYKYISFKCIDKEIVKNQIKYSLPLIPNQLSLWIMNSSDRIIVSYFLGAAANGILAISHKFPSVFMTFYNIFQLAWHETAIVHYNDLDRDAFFTDMFDLIISIFSTLCIVIILVLPIVFPLFINSDYSEAYYNIPIYMIAFLFNVVIGILGVIYVATKKTKEIAKTTIISAVLNLFIIVILINRFGLFAASISTFVGYFITMVYRIIDSKKYLNINYNYKKISCIIVLLLISCIIYYFNIKIISIISIFLFLPFLYIINIHLKNELLKCIKERFG